MTVEASGSYRGPYAILDEEEVAALLAALPVHLGEPPLKLVSAVDKLRDTQKADPRFRTPS